MIRRFLDPRRSRWTRAAVLATVAVCISATDAFACLDHCVRTFGSIRKMSDGSYWELESCTQRYNSGGGYTTICYYHVYSG